MAKFTVKYTSEIILFIFLILFFWIKQPYNEWDRVIETDGKAYYAYLTAIFIYQDLDFKFVEQYEDKYYPSDRSVFKEFRVPYKGDIVNRGFAGLAILFLPFFLIAHLLTLLFGNEPDGYSIIYQYTMGLATLFYLWVGCKFLTAFLKKFNKSDGLVSFVVFTIALGTNIVYYAIVESTMAHIYSFAVITGFFYFTIQAIEERKVKWYVLLTASYCLAIIIRPTNATFLLMILFLPGSFNSFKTEILAFTQNKKALIYSIVTIVTILSIPLVLWYLQTGHLFVYSYGEEGFDFSNPQINKTLFSYNRGWFVYTPIAFVSMFGFISLYKGNKYQFFVLLIILLLHLYIASCWRVWHFTSKFSIRVFIDFYAVIALLLLLLLNSIRDRKPLRYILYSLIPLMILLNLFQAYQQRIWVFPLEYVTKDIYGDSFGKTVPLARANISEEHIVNNKTVFNNFENKMGWENENTLIQLNGNTVSQIKDTISIGVGFKDYFQKYFTTKKQVIKISADIFSDQKNTGGSLVVEFLFNEINYSYNPLYLKTYNRQNKWVPVEFAFYTPELISSNDEIKIYFYNDSKNEVLMVDNMKIEFISLADDTEYIEHIKTPKVKSIKRVHILDSFDSDLGWQNSHTLSREVSLSGSTSCKINFDQQYSITFEQNIDTLIFPGKAYIKVNASVYSETPVTETRLIIDLINKGNSYSYNPFFIQDKVLPGEWSTIEYIYTVKEIKSLSDIVKIYFWNPSESEIIFIDDLNIEFISILNERDQLFIF